MSILTGHRRCWLHACVNCRHVVDLIGYDDVTLSRPHTENEIVVRSICQILIASSLHSNVRARLLARHQLSIIGDISPYSDVTPPQTHLPRWEGRSHHRTSVVIRRPLTNWPTDHWPLTDMLSQLSEPSRGRVTSQSQVDVFQSAWRHG